MRGQKGFALVITLVIMFLLVGLLMEFVNEVYVDASHSHNFVAAQQASIISESGVKVGKKVIELSPMINGSSNYSSLLDPWAKPLKQEAEEGTLIVNIEEESGKLNLNLATTTNGDVSDASRPYVRIATRLFKRLGVPAEDLIEALRDWVDTNDTPNPGGAESNYYSGLKFPYQAKNKRLETVEELALVKGFTPAIVAKLKPYITVYGAVDSDLDLTKININTAPREVIAALDEGMDDRLVDAILDYRKTKPFKDQPDLIANVPGMDHAINNIGSRICYLGAVYRIRAEGHVKDSVSVTEAVIRTGSNVPLYWREY